MFNVKEKQVKPIRIGKIGYEGVHSSNIPNGCCLVPNEDSFYIGIYLFNGRDASGKEYYNQSLHFNFGENLSISLRDNPYNSNDELQEKHLVITKDNLLYNCFTALLKESNPFTLIDNTDSGLAKEVVIVGFIDHIELSFINKREKFTSLNKFAVTHENYKPESMAINNFFFNSFKVLMVVQRIDEDRKKQAEQAKEEEKRLSLKVA